MTHPILAVLSVFLERRSDHLYGLELAKMTGLKSGTLYPILARLEDHALISSAWEEIDPAAVKRPRRRYYTLTGFGERAALDMLSRAQRRSEQRRVGVPRYTQPGVA